MLYLYFTASSQLVKVIARKAATSLAWLLFHLMNGTLLSRYSIRDILNCVLFNLVCGKKVEGTKELLAQGGRVYIPVLPLIPQYKDIIVQLFSSGHAGPSCGSCTSYKD